VLGSMFVILLLLVVDGFKAFEMEITPANRIVAQMGDAVVLTCNATGCASPSFSWRIQTDNPLGGTATHHGTYSTLTMSAVNINNAHDYLCTVCCKDEKKEKSVKIEVYSFPSDPVIEISASLAAGEQTIVTCKIPHVYPSDRLEVFLKKGDHVLHEQNFYEDHSTNAETKTVTYSFNLTTEDIGKEISCVAKLPIADMNFEPKERVTSQKLNANFGPKNTVIIASPSNSAMEGHSINLTCVTDSNPPPQIVWRRQVADKIVQCASENNVLTIPEAHFTDSGIYICEVTNLLTNKTEKATNTVISVIPAAVVKEGETVTMKCSSSGNPTPVISWKKKTATGESEKIFEDATLTIENIKSQDLGLYECEARNQFGGEERAVKLLVQAPPKNTTLKIFPSNAVKQGERVTISCTSTGVPTVQITLRKKTDGAITTLETQDGKYTLESVLLKDAGIYECVSSNELGEESQHLVLDVKDQMMLVIIAFSCVTAIAVPVVAILIYVSRQAKINGSYSLVKALRLKV
uniref:Vascular cell adhesion molecule 1 n=1 Tax=Nothoprocta perdicaria TaxID=30464 RepID=A0A8C6YZZ7_NOTPE